MKRKSLILSLFLIMLCTLPAQAAASYPSDSDDLSPNAYIEDFSFVAQGYGDYSGSEYVGRTSGTTTYNKVKCADVNEKYKIKYSGNTYNVDMRYYLTRDTSDDIRVLWYAYTVTNALGVKLASNSGTQTNASESLFIPERPSKGQTVFWGQVVEVSGTKLVIKRTQNLNGYSFTLYFELAQDRGYVKIYDASGASGFEVQEVTAEEAQYLASQQEDDSKKCFIGQAASAWSGLGLLLFSLALGLVRRRA